VKKNPEAAKGDGILQGRKEFRGGGREAVMGGDGTVWSKRYEKLIR